MEKITEESHKELCLSWYEEAKNIKLPELQKFINRLINGYDHDYGTICHAMAASGLASLHAANKEPGAGITGFQASIIDLQILKYWRHLEGPFKIVDFSSMLYPQSSDKFQKTINKQTWEWLKQEAQKKLEERPPHAHPEVIAHWIAIINGEVPFGYKVEVE